MPRVGDALPPQLLKLSASGFQWNEREARLEGTVLSVFAREQDAPEAATLKQRVAGHAKLGARLLRDRVKEVLASKGPSRLEGAKHQVDLATAEVLPVDRPFLKRHAKVPQARWAVVIVARTGEKLIVAGRDEPESEQLWRCLRKIGHLPESPSREPVSPLKAQQALDRVWKKLKTPDKPSSKLLELVQAARDKQATPEPAKPATPEPTEPEPLEPTKPEPPEPTKPEPPEPTKPTTPAEPAQEAAAATQPAALEPPALEPAEAVHEAVVQADDEPGDLSPGSGKSQPSDGTGSTVDPSPAPSSWWSRAPSHDPLPKPASRAASRAPSHDPLPGLPPKARPPPLVDAPPLEPDFAAWPSEVPECAEDSGDEDEEQDSALFAAKRRRGRVPALPDAPLIRQAAEESLKHHEDVVVAVNSGLLLAALPSDATGRPNDLPDAEAGGGLATARKRAEEAHEGAADAPAAPVPGSAAPNKRPAFPVNPNRRVVPDGASKAAGASKNRLLLPQPEDEWRDWDGELQALLARRARGDARDARADKALAELSGHFHREALRVAQHLLASGRDQQIVNGVFVRLSGADAAEAKAMGRERAAFDALVAPECVPRLIGGALCATVDVGGRRAWCMAVPQAGDDAVCAPALQKELQGLGVAVDKLRVLPGPPCRVVRAAHAPASVEPAAAARLAHALDQACPCDFQQLRAQFRAHRVPMSLSGLVHSARPNCLAAEWVAADAVGRVLKQLLRQDQKGDEPAAKGLLGKLLGQDTELWATITQRLKSDYSFAQPAAWRPGAAQRLLLACLHHTGSAVSSPSFGPDTALAFVPRLKGVSYHRFFTPADAAAELELARLAAPAPSHAPTEPRAFEDQLKDLAAQGVHVSGDRYDQLLLAQAKAERRRGGAQAKLELLRRPRPFSSRLGLLLPLASRDEASGASQVADRWLGKEHPESCRLRRLVADRLWAEGDLAQAAEVLRDCAQRLVGTPKHEQALQLLGLALVRVDAREALSVLAQLEVQDATLDQAEVLGGQADALLSLGEDPQRALAVAQDAFATEYHLASQTQTPRTLRALVRVARCALAADEPKEACDALECVLERAGDQELKVEAQQVLVVAALRRDAPRLLRADQLDQLEREWAAAPWPLSPRAIARGRSVQQPASYVRELLAYAKAGDAKATQELVELAQWAQGRGPLFPHGWRCGVPGCTPPRSPSSWARSASRSPERKFRSPRKGKSPLKDVGESSSPSPPRRLRGGRTRARA